MDFVQFVITFVTVHLGVFFLEFFMYRKVGFIVGIDVRFRLVW